MTYTSNRGFPAGNPIANALVIFVGALTIAASLVLGFFAFLVLASLLLVFAAIVGIRMWWFRRKYQKAARSGPSPGDPRRTKTLIEGEFRVVTDDDSPEDAARR